MVKVSEAKKRRRHAGRAEPRRRGGTTGEGPRGRSVRFAGAAIILCAALSALVALEHLVNAGEIRRGVSVGDVALGGKTPEEALTALDRHAPRTPEQVRLSGPGLTLDVPTKDLDVRLGTRATIREAYAVGRRGSLPRRLVERAGSLFGVSVPAEVRYRPGALRATLDGLASRANRQPRDASVTVSGSEVRSAGAGEGYRLDVPATAANLRRALEDLSAEAEMSGTVLRPEVTTDEAEAAARDAREAVSAPLVLAAEGESWTLSPEEVGAALNVTRGGGTLQVDLDHDRLKEEMADAYAALQVQAVEAGYDVGSGAPPEIEVTPSREGRRIEEEKLFGAIEDGLFGGRHEYAVPVATDQAELTTAEAEKLEPTELLGTYRTNYAVVPDDGTRVENLGISSGAVNGTLLAPGEVFSMNRKVSHLDYNDSKVIVGGEETTADGGGLCQVTSTLYNAANFAGLDVIERTPHSAQLPYIRPGMDATVWWGVRAGPTTWT